MLAPQHAVSLCKSVGSPARWAAYEKVLPSLHAGPTVSFYYWDLIFCVRYSVASWLDTTMLKSNTVIALRRP